MEASETSMYLVETNEETIQVDDGEGNTVDVTIIENIYSSTSGNIAVQGLTPTEELGTRKTYTIRISNEAIGAPSFIVGGVDTLLKLGVANKAATIVANAITKKLGANFIPGVNIASWLLGAAAFVNGLCGNKGIAVNLELEYRGIFWHREDRYTYGWYPNGVSVNPY